MTYIVYHFLISPKELGSEILLAELDGIGFDSFEETEKGLDAYIKKENCHAGILSPVKILNSKEFVIIYSKEELPQINWNSEWEKNFNPILIENEVGIRAPFHKKIQNVDYEIVIEPKMSFGTGHHETTHVMIQHILELDLEEKKVLDMGCGTGVLAILAEMKGAKHIDAIDIDTWSCENSIENIERNNCHCINVFKGDALLLKNKTYDVVLANINRNILLRDIKIYSKSLKKGGMLLLSGFYTKDVPAIELEVVKYNFKTLNHKVINDWIGIKFIKL
ncbi:MAG: 50S ribosomal protein L11 methyltransferase [Flavobacteriaceae bacterium]|nr:50S ribosomal protein L11 methyltransferase [Flavobacteriaceae bacterium]